MGDVDVIQAFYQHRAHAQSQGAQTNGVTLCKYDRQVAWRVGTTVIVLRGEPTCPDNAHSYFEWMRLNPPAEGIHLVDEGTSVFTASRKLSNT